MTFLIKRSVRVLESFVYATNLYGRSQFTLLSVDVTHINNMSQNLCSKKVPADSDLVSYSTRVSTFYRRGTSGASLP